MIENRAVWSSASASVGTARGGLNHPGGFLGAQEPPNMAAVRNDSIPYTRCTFKPIKILIITIFVNH
jgi:hypothetical protein